MGTKVYRNLKDTYFSGDKKIEITSDSLEEVVDQINDVVDEYDEKMDNYHKRIKTIESTNDSLAKAIKAHEVSVANEIATLNDAINGTTHNTTGDTTVQIDSINKLSDDWRCTNFSGKNLMTNYLRKIESHYYNDDTNTDSFNTYPFAGVVASGEGVKVSDTTGYFIDNIGNSINLPLNTISLDFNTVQKKMTASSPLNITDNNITLESTGVDIPSCPSADGSYALVATVTSGVVTYTWVDVMTFGKTDTTDDTTTGE